MSAHDPAGAPVTPALTEAEWAERIDAWVSSRHCSTWGRAYDVQDDEERGALVAGLAAMVVGAAGEEMA